MKSNILLKIEDIGLTYSVHNGNQHVEILVVEDMVNHFLGEFLLTKRLGSSIHLKKKKKKGKQKK